ncbi:MAG TPA: hypothetical protein GX725_00885 [Mollicutes bacterium]|nr:hypothetical protein [Mollicutes bacterium]
MNNKGMSTIELMVSFVIISIVAIGMFKSVIDLMDKVEFYQHNMKITVLKGSITNSLQGDLVNRKLYKYDTCGSNCYDITFQDLTTKRFMVDSEKNLIQYGGISDKIPEDFIISGAILVDITNKAVSGDVNDSIFRIFIPIENKALGITTNINVVHQYDSKDMGNLPPL